MLTKPLTSRPAVRTLGAVVALACSVRATSAQGVDTVHDVNDTFLPRLQRAIAVLSHDTVDIPLEDTPPVDWRYRHIDE